MTLSIIYFNVTLSINIEESLCWVISYCYAECRYAECRYAECRYAECLNAECFYAECRYAECRYAEYCGALSAIMANVIKLPGALICTWV